MVGKRQLIGVNGSSRWEQINLLASIDNWPTYIRLPTDSLLYGLQIFRTVARLKEMSHYGSRPPTNCSSITPINTYPILHPTPQNIVCQLRLRASLSMPVSWCKNLISFKPICRRRGNMSNEGKTLHSGSLLIALYFPTETTTSQNSSWPIC